MALLRAAPTGPPPEAQAIAVGFLGALRALAATAPLLVAIDDLHWLDPPSADALSVRCATARREPVRVLLAKRAGTSSALEQALEPGGLETLHIGPLSLGATRRILLGRLGLTLPRHLLRRIFDSTLGNPLFALEIGRQLVDSALPAIGDDLPVPTRSRISSARGWRPCPARCDGCSSPSRLSPNLRLGQLTALTDPETLDLAVEAGVLVVDGEQVRASHPLLVAAATRQARAAERRELHRELAERVLRRRAAHAPPCSRRCRSPTRPSP